MQYNVIILMVGAAVVGHCLFLFLVLMRLSRKLANRLLALLLLFLAIRIGACIAGLLYNDFEFTGSYFGAVSVAMIGPLFYFYQRSLWDPSFVLTTKDYFHLIPAVGILIAMPVASIKITAIMYVSSLLSMVVYLIAGFLKWRALGKSNKSDDVRWKWALYFNSGIALIATIFIGQLFFLNPLAYRTIVVVSALVCYFLSLWAVKHVKLFMREPQKKNAKQQVQVLGGRIEKVLKQEEMFTNPLLTVSVLAKHLNTPAYLVSLAINEYFEKSFPEMLNEQRINKAKEMLVDFKKKDYTIEAIAYESGFSTLSTFYAVFKKATFKTPSQFRKHNSNESKSES